MGVVAEPVQGGRGSVWLRSGKATGCVGGKEPCQGHNTPGKAPDMMSFLQNLTSYHWVHCVPFLRMLPPQRSPNSMCSCLRVLLPQICSCHRGPFFRMLLPEDVPRGDRGGPEEQSMELPVTPRKTVCSRFRPVSAAQP